MSKVYKVGDVFYNKGLNCYVKAVASDSRYCDGNKCALHTSDCTTTIDNCIGIRFIKVPAPNCSVKFCPESSWGVKPTDKTEEIRSDRVIADKRSASNTWSFQLQMDNGYRPASISVTASKTAENCKFTAAILPDTERFIVCLVENDKLAPSDSPKQHKTRESAEKEAERLCKLYHQEFVVLKVTASFKPQQPKKEVFA